MTDLVVGLGSLRVSSGLMNVGRTTLVGKFGPELVELAGRRSFTPRPLPGDLARAEGAGVGAGGKERAFHI